MPRKVLFGTLAAAFMAAAAQTLAPATAYAQASCMHCNFAFAQCKRVGSMTPDQCKEQQTTCIKECKGMGGEASSPADKAKAADKDGKNKNN